MLGPHIPRRHSAAGGSQSRPKLMGCIMWLPARDVMDLGFDNGVYNHPVVILSPISSVGEVDFCSLTSFGGTTLVDKFPNDKKARSRYLPIKPSAPHPDNKILLELSEAEDGLAKDSYIHISKVLRAKLKALRPYAYHRLRTPYLSEASYRQLVQQAQYSPRSVSFGDWDWTLISPPSQSVPGAREPRYDTPERSFYGGISSPQGHAQRTFAYSQINLPQQARYNERAPLLPSPQPASPPRPALTRRIWERTTRAIKSLLISTDWKKVFEFLWVGVVIITACYGIHWVVVNSAQLVSASWLWLRHTVTHMVEAVKNWFGKLLGHTEII